MYSHLGKSRHTVKRLPSVLHVVAVVFNPLRFQSRYNLYKEFEKHASDNPEVDLLTVELALGNRPFEVTSPDNPKHLQLRTETELWHKERMINVAVERLPDDWEYCAWIDADVTFLNPDWAHETLQQLQHYKIVQMFTHAMDVDASGAPLEFFEGFAYSYITGDRQFPKLHGVNPTTTFGKEPSVDPHHRHGPPDVYTPVDINHHYYMPKPKGTLIPEYYGRYWHPGYGWAYRREAWNTIGGLLDINIVGGGDHQMAYGLIGKIDETIPVGSTPQYSKMVKQWAVNAEAIKRDIGAVPGTVTHHFHGPKNQRGYYNRWKILTDNAFDPVVDVKNDWQDMLQLTGNKIELRDQLRAYFRQRNEDAI